jgi:hypothetical protein
MGGVQFSNLPNVEADANLIAKKLADVGFSEVYKAISSENTPWITQQDILRTAYDLRKTIEEEIKAGDLTQPAIVIYYAGHGFSWRGEHYLVPADFFVQFAEDIPRFGIPLAHLVRAVAGPKPLSVFVIIDACRDLPFGILPSLMGGKENVTGPAQFPRIPEIENATIFFSTLNGFTVPDGTAGSHSPFAQTFAELFDRGQSGRGAHLRSFEDTYSPIVMQLSPGGKYKPDMRRSVSPYQVPFVRTRADFEEEKKTWTELKKVYGDEARSIADRFVETGREIVYSRSVCALQAFLPEHAASYFGQEARKLYRLISNGGRIKCESQEAQDLLPQVDEVLRRPISFAEIASPELRQRFVEWNSGNSQTPLATSRILQGRANFRTTPRGGNDNIRRTLPSGEAIQFDGFEGPTFEWARVTHPTLGRGFVAAQLVADPVLPITTVFKFAAGKREPFEESRAHYKELLGKLGPGVLLDVYLRYDAANSTLAIGRALSVSSFINEVVKTTTPDTGLMLPPLLIADEAVASDTVEVDLQILPISPGLRELPHAQVVSKGKVWLNIERSAELDSAAKGPALIGLQNFLVAR